MRSSNADSSSWPTSGETWSKLSWRPSSRRDVVDFLALSMASRACWPSFSPGKPPSGPSLFPSFAPSPSGCVVPKISPHSSVMISSVVRIEPSRRRTRPDRAMRMASRPTDGVVIGCSRSAANDDDDRGRVEGAAHRRTDAQVGVRAGAPDELDDLLQPAVVGRRHDSRDDRLLLLGRLVVDAEAADAVVHGAARCAPCRRRRTGSSPRRAGTRDRRRCARGAGRAARARSSR